MAEQALPVGLGEIKVTGDPGEVLVAYGLGSCVGVGVYDPVAKVAGLLHAGKVRLSTDAGDEITSVADAGVQDLFEKDRGFKAMAIAPAGDPKIKPQDRARIRELFGKLGYGAYVRRLDVATFHGFATRHLGRLVKDTDDWNKDRTTLLHRFADRLETDAVFRASVTAGLRTLLVDEFQDVNEEIYKILRLLSSMALLPTWLITAQATEAAK